MHYTNTRDEFIISIDKSRLDVLLFINFYQKNPIGLKIFQ